ncbi:ketopantoate reductase family protein [Humidisolicoccus flavus]|uniref:ketopantoate reductase family protein n=1 Tax=Humidisolicoccus flavus TaxID=3111414 RepID=UPI00325281E7
MRIAVIGAGAIGGALAALLSNAGHEVTVTARGAHLEAMRREGLSLRGAFGTSSTHPTAVETLEATPDLAILATKTTGTDAALTANAEALREVPLLVVQNGVGSELRAAALLGSTQVAGGIAVFAANALEPGVVHVTAPGSLVIGGDAAARFAPVLSPLLPVTTVHSITGAQWTKLSINMINPFPAITNLSAQDVISHRGLRWLLLDAMRETVRTAHALGVRLETVSGLTPALSRLIERGPKTLSQIVPLRMRAAMGATPNLGSTLQSIRRGVPSEIDDLSGHVVRSAKQTWTSAPVNALLVRAVHDVETGGRHWSPEELLRTAKSERD